jgi:hypothetical protein
MVPSDVVRRKPEPIRRERAFRHSADAFKNN